NDHVEYTPKAYVSRSIIQKSSGGLCVNGVPSSVGRKNAPARISRTTCAYFVSSPTNNSRDHGESKTDSATTGRMIVRMRSRVMWPAFYLMSQPIDSTRFNGLAHQLCECYNRLGNWVI